MYHYKSCGLDYVYLSSGYTWHYAEGEEIGISICEPHHLLHEIGRITATGVRPLGALEFQYLRTDLNLSHAQLGLLFGFQAEEIKAIEAGNKTLTIPVEKMLRDYYLETRGDLLLSAREFNHINASYRVRIPSEYKLIMAFDEDSKRWQNTLGFPTYRPAPSVKITLQSHTSKEPK